MDARAFARGPMSDIRYAVHTRTCTYLLDEDGICRWILSAAGRLPSSVQRCVGAQFVACIDGRVPGGLAGELVIGASALFVAPADGGSGRLVLLRTAPIGHVEVREPAGSRADEPPVEAAAWSDDERDAEGDLLPPDDAVDVETTHDLAPDELELFPGDEAAVTVTLPLFRPGPARPERGGRGLA